MNQDWDWKLRETVERLKSSYEHLGRKTGAPFLAVVYPPEAEAAVQKEWRALQGALGAAYDLRYVDALAVVAAAVSDLGVENVLDALNNPMPGANPEAELGNLWVQAVAQAVRAQGAACCAPRPVVVVENLAALYPAASPRDLMQALWDTTDEQYDGPILLFIPGRLSEARVYEFLNQPREFMYRGDLL